MTTDLHEALDALEVMVKWHGERHKADHDRLLPADAQQPEVARAMLILAKHGRDVIYSTPTPEASDE